MAVAGRHLHGGRTRRGRLPVRYPAVCHPLIYSTRRPAIFRPTGLSGPAPHLGCCRGPPSRHLAAPAPAGSLDSTRATQTPRCGGSRTGAICHRRAPRFDRRRGCSLQQPSGAAARISPRRSPNPASVDALLSSRERCHVIYSPVHEHRAGGRIGVVAVRPRASFARGEQLGPHSPRLRSTFPLIHVSGQANSEHDMEALGGMWGCTTRRCRRWRSAAWWVGGEARGVPGSSCRSARGGRRLWVGLGSLAMRPAVSKIQNLTHSDPAMRRIRGLRVPCCCVERASPKSQRLLRYAVFRLLKLPLPHLSSCIRLSWLSPHGYLRTTSRNGC